MGKVIINVTVDWDGFDDVKLNIFNTGIGALTKFIKEFADVPLVHFICPVYFSRNVVLAEYYREVIKNLINEHNCEIGLHVHCWKSLVEACGVKCLSPHDARNIPSFHGAPERELIVEYEHAASTSTTSTDLGHGVPLGIYAKRDIEIIIQKSKQLLCENLFLNPRGILSFRCGGALAADNVLTCLSRAGLRYDSSAIDSVYFKAIDDYLREHGNILGLWLQKIWGPTCPDEGYLWNNFFRKTYPRGIRVCGSDNTTDKKLLLAAQPGYLDDNLIEFPMTGLLADYTHEEYMTDQLDKAVEIISGNETQNIVMGIGFHMESACWTGVGKGRNMDKICNFVRYARGKYAGCVEFRTIRETHVMC